MNAAQRLVNQAKGVCVSINGLADAVSHAKGYAERATAKQLTALGDEEKAKVIQRLRRGGAELEAVQASLAGLVGTLEKKPPTTAKSAKTRKDE